MSRFVISARLRMPMFVRAYAGSAPSGKIRIPSVISDYSTTMGLYLGTSVFMMHQPIR